MDRDKDLEKAIKQRDLESVSALIFEGDTPVVRHSFRTESDLWDYKIECPDIGKDHQNAWANLAVDVLAFHNNRGGVLIFGIRDTDFAFIGCSTRLDSKLVNDQLRQFLGDRVWVEYHRHFIQADQRYLGLAVIPSRAPALVRFSGDAPEIKNKRRFRKGYSAIRDGDESKVLDSQATVDLSRDLSAPTLGRVYEVDVPFFRILAPEYKVFIEREKPCRDVMSALSDPRAAVTTIVGIGGAGKTALATWAALQAYNQNLFEFIISVTAKDRELTSSGILALSQGITSFEGLLQAIIKVLDLPELKTAGPSEQEALAREVLTNSNGLLYVDNLETIDDPRLVQFLDNLPVGVRAITTSRRSRIRVSVHPVDLGPLTDKEACKFIKSLANETGLSYINELSNSEAEAIGSSCDGIPLAIRWSLTHFKSAAEAVRQSDEITRSLRRPQEEELLEFCFRRVFENMSGYERRILQVLSLFQRPISAEALQIGCSDPHHTVMDATEDLISDALIQRLFDPDLNDYCYTLLPIVRSFAYFEVSKERELEQQIRRRLSDWYEAKDIGNLQERQVVREIRQGRGSSEESLVDLAKAARRRGDFDAAEQMFEQALQRNPTSWRAAREFGEFERHERDNKAKALTLYERAFANAPSRGHERALTCREYGLLLRDSGELDATDRAIEKFDQAREEEPNDPICCVALAGALERKGSYQRIIDILEPLESHSSIETRRRVHPLLLKAYDQCGEIVKAARLRSITQEGA